MTDEPHLYSKVDACPWGDDGQTLSDIEFRKIHIAKHDKLPGKPCGKLFGKLFW